MHFTAFHAGHNPRLMAEGVRWAAVWMQCEAIHSLKQFRQKMESALQSAEEKQTAFQRTGP